MPHSLDFVIVGAGVIGLRCAIEAKRRDPDARVVVIEKEEGPGRHASGRNSGVLHAGFYYAADSLKGRFTREGNRRLSAYCEERGLPINRCGKLVVARDAADLAVLDELRRRGRRNGVELIELSSEEAQRIEPRVKTHERALFSPATASVDPGAVVSAYAREARELGVELRARTAFRGRGGEGRIATSSGALSTRFLINAAGLHADRVARAFGLAERYRILPFKGLYLKAPRGALALRTNIYPPPDLTTPFLGVHLTVAADGRVSVGPTALPALWRENYHGLANFAVRELIEVLRTEGRMFMSNADGFRDVALRELPKLGRRELLGQAAALVRGVRPQDDWRWGEPGIRAQLVDVTTYRLENDFVIEGDESSLHILNAVSPAFTCAIPFGEFVLDQAANLIG